jgi:hypothetical protein
MQVPSRIEPVSRTHAVLEECPEPLSLETLAVVQQVLAEVLQGLRQRAAPRPRARPARSNTRPGCSTCTEPIVGRGRPAVRGVRNFVVRSAIRMPLHASSREASPDNPSLQQKEGDRDGETFVLRAVRGAAGVVRERQRG